MTRFAIKATAGAGFLFVAGALLFFFLAVDGPRVRAAEPTSPTDPIAAFLARHWPNPIPPQGRPPAQFSTLEASLAPDACGQCHADQYRDWRTSLHSNTVGPGLLWQFRLMDQQAANDCMRCHAPLAEQKALMALERGWSAAPSSPPPAYVSANLDHQGLVCAACHVRAHLRFGPPARTPNAGPLAHAGFQASPAFEDSRFCAVCHQFRESGPRLNGKFLENTYEEWRRTRFARVGQSCQSCHMPDRRHLWRGIHDPAMTARALTVTLDLTALEAGQMRARARITNTGAGHHFPTYLVPEVVFSLQLVDPEGRPKGEIARMVVARRANVELTQEEFDRRIRSGETRVLDGRFARPAGGGWGVDLLMTVSPGAHYLRSFQYALQHTSNVTGETRRLLNDALDQVEKARYHVTLAHTVIR